MKEIKPIFPQEKIKVEGEVLTIKSFPFGEIDEFFKMVDFAQVVLVNILQEDYSSAAAILFMEEGQRLKGYLLQIIELTTGKGAEWVNTLGYDIVLQLIAEILRVNKDFFMKLGKSSGLQVAMEAVSPSTGPKSTADSEVPDSPIGILED